MITQSFKNWVGRRYGASQPTDVKIKAVNGLEYTTVPVYTVYNYSSGGTHERYVYDGSAKYILDGILTSVAAVSGGSDPDLATMSLYNNIPLLVLGAGTTPATINDYTIEQPIYTMKCDAIARTPIKDDDDIIGYQSVLTFSNQTEDDVTFSEIGIIALLRDLTLNGSTSAKNVLIEHTTLDTPVTVAPNETVNILYKITF